MQVKSIADSAILSIFIKLPFVIKIFFLSFLSGRFTQVLLYCCVFRLLEKVYNLDEATPHSLDPYSDDNKAPFYRQPAGLRRAKKHDEKEELGNEILL